MEVYLIRHTQVAVDKSICYGQSEVSLAETFATDALVLEQKLKQQIGELQAAKILSSPAQRCRLLAEYLGQEIEYHPVLLELNFGQWEMQAWKDLPPEEVNPWMEDFVHLRPPDGENFAELQARTTSVFDTLPQSEHSPVLIIAHAGVIRSIICKAIGLPLSNAFQIEIDYGSVSKLVYRWGLWNVKFLNL
jgi:alpha-ribazole phosphatase